MRKKMWKKNSLLAWMSGKQKKVKINKLYKKILI